MSPMTLLEVRDRLAAIESEFNANASIDIGKLDELREPVVYCAGQSKDCHPIPRLARLYALAKQKSPARELLMSAPGARIRQSVAAGTGRRWCTPHWSRSRSMQVWRRWKAGVDASFFMSHNMRLPTDLHPGTLHFAAMARLGCETCLRARRFVFGCRSGIDARLCGPDRVDNTIDRLGVVYNGIDFDLFRPAEGADAEGGAGGRISESTPRRP